MKLQKLIVSNFRGLKGNKNTQLYTLLYQRFCIIKVLSSLR